MLCHCLINIEKEKNMGLIDLVFTWFRYSDRFLDFAICFTLAFDYNSFTKVNKLAETDHTGVGQWP